MQYAKTTLQQRICSVWGKYFVLQARGVNTTHASFLREPKGPDPLRPARRSIYPAWSFPRDLNPILSNTIPNINQESITNINMAAGNEFERFLQSINLAEEYLDKFVKTGYNDMALLKSLESQEQQDIFDLTGLLTKPSHRLKFKKAIVSYDNTSFITTQGKKTHDPANIPPKKVQRSKFPSLGICYNFPF